MNYYCFDYNLITSKYNNIYNDLKEYLAESEVLVIISYIDLINKIMNINNNYSTFVINGQYYYLNILTHYYKYNNIKLFDNTLIINKNINSGILLINLGNYDNMTIEYEYKEITEDELNKYDLINSFNNLKI